MPLELDDIQGNILAGFNTDFQAIVGLTVEQADKYPDAAQWLAAQANSIATVAEVRAQRELMKKGLNDPKTTWLSIAVGERLLSKTQPDVRILDDAFIRGMLIRAPSVLGDKTDPALWTVGGADAPLDVLLIVAANNETAVDARADELVASAAQAGLRRNYRDMARRLDDFEHFGFRDGISQPLVLNDARDAELGAGRFVFGYPRVAGDAPFSPTMDERGVTKNGSLLVFRRLKQDVRVFREFCADEAHRLAAQWPQLSERRLAALLVGRWPSGALVEASATQDPGGSSPGNGFDFHDDADGLSCPLGAHIRKVNPRNGRKDVVEVPRLLRRGIPFGPRFEVNPDAERGLIFLAYQTSIKSQFEFLTQHWMNSSEKPARGHDLLVGRSEDRRSLTVMGPNGPVEVLDDGREWIRSTGGAYLFAPSRSGLAKFGTPPAHFGFWKVKQLFAVASHNIRIAAFGDTAD